MVMKSLLRITAIAAITTVSAFGAGSGSAGPAEQPAVKEKSAAVKEKSAAVRPVVKEESPAVRAYNEGVKLMQDKRFAQAQPKFEQAIKLDPDFAEAYNNLAFVLRKQGSANFPKSLAYYNKAIELKPKLAEAYMYRGVSIPRWDAKAMRKRTSPPSRSSTARWQKSWKSSCERARKRTIFTVRPLRSGKSVIYRFKTAAKEAIP